MKLDLAQADAARDSSELARRVGRIVELLEAGEPVDLDVVCRDVPECRDQLAALLPTLQAVVDLDQSLSTQEPLESRSSASGLQPHSPGRLGDFRLIRELGRGGMGVVYEAEQISLGRRVALKVLPYAAMLDKQQLARFKNEARAAATLDHPNIVQVHSVGVERGVHYYAMHLVEGESLAQVIARLRQERAARNEERAGSKEQGAGSAELDATIAHESAPVGQSKIQNPKSTIDTAPIAALSTQHAPHSSPGTPWVAPTAREYFRTIARLGIQAAEALDHAHQNGILHRDVKPANLLVDDEGKLWVTDFGLARLETDAGMTMTGDLIGTLRYMSPEQALAQRVVVDHRSDVYSLGVTIYELLTLDPAYPAQDRQELLRQIAFEEPHKPQQHNPRIPQDLETIVLKAIEKNPVQRYATAAELAADLRRYLGNEPIKAKPMGWRGRAVKWARRHPAGVRASAVAVLTTTVAVAASVGWIARDRATRYAALVDQVSAALQEVQKSCDAGNPSIATSALMRAKSLIAGETEGDELTHAVQKWQTELTTLHRLEEIRINSIQYDKNGRRSVARSYRDAFLAYGIDVTRRSPEQTARLIRQSPIRFALVEALDDWSGTEATDADFTGSSKAASVRLSQIASMVDPDSWRERLRLADRNSDSGAILELADATDVDDLPTSTLLMLTGALSTRGNPEKAVQILELAQRKQPQDVWINLQLADCLRDLTPPQYAEAIGHLRAVVALRPDSAPHLNLLAVALEQSEAYEAAEAAYRRCVELDPNFAWGHYNLVALLLRTGRNSEAKAAFREAPQLTATSSPEAVLLCARTLFYLGERPEGFEALTLAIRLAPNWSEPREFFLTALPQGRDQGHQEVLSQALRHFPDDSWFLAHYGAVLLRLGKYDEAEQVYRKAFSRPAGLALADERTHRTNWLIAQANLANGSAADELWDKAAAELAVAVDNAPDDGPSTKNQRKGLCRELARWDEAFDRVATLRPDEPCLWIGRAQMRVLQNRWSDAVSDYDRVISLRPIEIDCIAYASALLMLDDDGARYREFCNKQFARLDESLTDYEVGQVIRMCLLATNEKIPLQTILDLAAKQAENDPTAVPTHNLGLAQYRARQYDESIQTLTQNMNPTWLGISQTWAILAMAHYRLAHAEQASECWARAESEQQPIDSPYFCDWAELQVLRKEAAPIFQRPNAKNDVPVRETIDQSPP